MMSSELPECIWISSYPKSGNTWLRFIITAAIFGEIPGSAFIEAVIPDLYRGINIWQYWDQAPIKMAKTHFEAENHFDITAGLENRIGRQRVIYVVRNPLDVACSQLRFEGHGGNVIDRFIEQGGSYQYRENGFGWWAEHVSSWRDRIAPEDTLFLRYEDMLAQPDDAVRRIVHFIGYDLPPERIIQIVHDSSFSNLKSLEQTERAASTPGFFANHAAQYQGVFMKEGRFGTFRDIMTPEQIVRALERFGPDMTAIGYDLNDFAP